ncbi:MAG: hypothetical protein ACNA8S_09970 [Deferrisomatales bacterium]
MDDRMLLENLAKLGMPFLEVTEGVDVSETIAEVVKSHDKRFWEGFPVLMANASKRTTIAVDEISRKLNEDQKKEFRKLLMLTLALFSVYHLSYSWSEEFKRGLSGDEKNLVIFWRNRISRGLQVSLDGEEFDAGRLRKYFSLYLSESARNGKDKKQRFEDLSLEYAQSQIFSPKQKEIFNKKWEGAVLTKTEQEYYSRTVKKKVVALANSELHALAKRLLEQA